MLRVLVLRPGLTVLSRASSNLSMSTIHAISGKMGLCEREMGNSLLVVARDAEVLRTLAISGARIVRGNIVIGGNSTSLIKRVGRGNFNGV